MYLRSKIKHGWWTIEKSRINWLMIVQGDSEMVDFFWANIGKQEEW